MTCLTDRPSGDRSYRLYPLSAADRIVGAESRMFDSDSQALFHAQSLLAKHPAVEVWQTDRFVCRLDRADLIQAVR